MLADQLEKLTAIHMQASPVESTGASYMYMHDVVWLSIWWRNVQAMQSSLVLQVFLLD